MVKRLISGAAIILCFLTLLIGCNEMGSIESKIFTHFNGAFPKKGIDITRELGSDLFLDLGGVVEKYHLEYFRADHTTEIKDANGTIIFNGPVSRYRGLYFFNVKKSDSTYWLAAMDIKNKTVKGFANFAEQMLLIQDSMMNWKDIKPKSKHPGYLLTLNDTEIKIQVEKKAAYRLYSEILEKLPFYNIVDEGPASVAEETKAAEIALEKKEITPLIRSIGPNPASGNVTIWLDKNRGEDQKTVTLTLRDLTGKKLDKGSTNNSEYSFELSRYPPGSYLLEAKTSLQTATEKLIIER